MQRILFIRGGAIGDFILTLPAVALVQAKWPEARIEVLGYPAIAELGHQRGYFDAVRSMDHRSLAGFFIPNNILDPDWMDHFGSFDLVVSYLFDPDSFFRHNVEKCEPGQIITVSPKVVTGRPAAFHLASPLEKLGLKLDSPHAKVYPSAEDETTARAWLKETGLTAAQEAGELLVVHPGSGSAAKNWPDSLWQKFFEAWLAAAAPRRVILVGGEAEGNRLQALRQALTEQVQSRIAVAENLALPVLAALLQQADRFLGHDSGISHLAAAVDTRSLLLFGPTDATTWSPQGEHVTVLPSPTGAMGDIAVETVLQKLSQL